ncbi:GA-like domain-containing protein, partial [Escherichia coli]|uniref:GA-like domain-containing protein n=1 Tax=Escherichia coli TaxID=562 RepID=UPI000A19D9CC
VDAKAAEAEKAVAAAEAADKAAKDKLAEANADKLITPDEKAQLEQAKQNADTLKADADTAVKALPDEAGAKAGLQGRVDKLDGITVPEVNNQDGNGIPDGYENLSESTDPIYTGNINNSDSNALLTMSTNYMMTGSYNYSLREDQLPSSMKAIVNANPGGFDATVSPSENTGNRNGLTTFNLHGDEDKIISTTKSLGNIAVGGADYILDLTMSTLNGDDVFVIGRDAGFTNTSGDGHSLTVSTNGGDDIFISGASNTDHKVIYGDDGILRLEDSSYNLKDGEFLFSTGNYSSSSSDGGTIHNALIKMGDGNDTFIALGQKGNAQTLHNSDINMGAGNDTVILYGDITGPGNMVKGDAGMDTLTHNWGKLSSGDISGFEKLNLGSHSEFNMKGDYLSGLEGVTLKITGESDTKVILESNASVNTGTWSQGADRMEDGVNYHVYNNSNYPAAQVLIEDDIHNVTIK